ncbi:hypothetical protein PRIPAC_72687 [Pristionchus pacificus]|nr:hypothetical protein PRIPAC_72687 [Pristionchus pacificus]
MHNSSDHRFSLCASAFVTSRLRRISHSERKEGRRTWIKCLIATRAQLTSCFESFSCYLLPHPGFRVAERKSYKGEAKDIRPEFRDEVRKMTESLLAPGALQPNKMNGKQVTCKKIMQCFKEYAKTFDSSTIPLPMNLLQANARLLRYDAIQEAKKVYRAEMDKETTGNSLLSERKLMRLHIQCQETAIQAYHQFPKITAEDDDDERNCEELKTFIEIEFERYKQLNNAKTLLGCRDTLMLGVGLGVGTTSAIAGSVLAATAGIGTAGVVGVPVAVVVATGAWSFYIMKPRLMKCFASSAQETAPLLATAANTRL